MEIVLRKLRRFGAHSKHVHNSQGVTNQLTLKITWYLQIQSQVKNRMIYNRDRAKCTPHSLSKNLLFAAGDRYKKTTSQNAESN